MDPEVASRLEELRAAFAPQQQRADALLAADPDMHPLTAIVIAGDVTTAERWYKDVQGGAVKPEEGVWLVGSYARLDFALRLVNEGLLERSWLLDNLPDIWRGSDPDDTDRRFWDLWVEAYVRNGRRRILDDLEKPLPVPKGNRRMRLYRGQRSKDPLGISWSLSEVIAKKFAGGAGTRAPIKDPTVYTILIHPHHVIAYLTRRGEQEIILNPDVVPTL